MREAGQEYSYPKEMISNIDETPMYFDMVSNKTDDRKGRKTISVHTAGAKKRHLTVVLPATADGQLLPPTIVFKGKRH